MVTTDETAALARSLARGAGERLLELRRRDDGRDPAALRLAGDRVAQDWLAGELARVAPDDAVLSEEATDDLARLEADRVWIIDPLDGTREFSEHDGALRWRNDFAVHVAVWTRTDGLSAGAVALPGRDHVTSSADVRPAPSDPDLVAGRRPPRIAASRSHPPEIVDELARRGATLVRMGSAGVKVLSVVDGTTDAYVHAGGQYEWDSAAPVAVARAAGLVCTRLDGSSLEYNRPDPWLPDLVVCHPSIQAALRAELDSIVPATGGAVR